MYSVQLMYSMQFVVYSVQCAVYSVHFQFLAFSVKCEVRNVGMFTEQCAVCSVQCANYDSSDLSTLSSQHCHGPQ